MTELGDAAAEPFSCPARDPSGTAYSVDVVSLYGAVSGVFLGRSGSGAAGPVLGMINRVLARMQPEPEPVEVAMVIVYRVVNGKSEDIHNVPVRDHAQGRSTALAIAAQIESGNFQAEG